MLRAPRPALPPTRREARDRRPLRRLVVALAFGLPVVLALAGCDAFTPRSPQPTPTDFAGIVQEFEAVGIGVEHATSGDAGCNDQRLARTAIGFDAKGLDQATIVRVYLYAFRDQPTYDSLRPLVDACARTYITDPATYLTTEATPYVLAGRGPWAPAFAAALAAALRKAAVGG